MFETLYDDIRIQSQYQNTNIESLLNGIKEIRINFIVKALESAISEVFNLETMSGDALDMWGRLLDFSRYVPISSEGVGFRNLSFYDRNFFLAKFFDAADIKYAELSDPSYRKVLQLLWRARNVSATLRNNTKLAKITLDADIITGDSMNMEFITYYFRDQIPNWLNNILTKYDILPRPAGVGLKFVSAFYRIFGFETDSFDYNREYLANFFNAQFVRPEIAELNYFANAEYKDSEYLEFYTIIENLKGELSYQLSDNSSFYNNSIIEKPTLPPFPITPQQAQEDK